MTTEKFQDANPRDLIANSNIRMEFDEQSIQGMMKSLEAVKMLQPIRVHIVDGKPVIIDGARRCMSAIRLDWDEVPIVIDSKVLNEAETIQRQLIANCQHEHLNVVERAMGIFELKELTKWSSSVLADQIGLTDSEITKSLAILTLPKESLEMVRQGAIAASCAYELTKVKDPVFQASLAEQLSQGKLTRDELVGAIRKKKTNAVPKPKDQSTIRAMASLDANRTVTVTGPSLDMAGFIASLEELLNKARKERTRGVVLSTFIRVLRDQARSSPMLKEGGNDVGKI
jgi:ParB/RepB/Spo0J family partition protein